MLSNLTASPSTDTLRILQIIADAEQKPAIEGYQPTEEELKVLADFRDPRVENAFNFGLAQLLGSLLQNMASKGTLPASLLEELDLLPFTTHCNTAAKPSHNFNNPPDGGNSNTPTSFPTQIQYTPPSPPLQLPSTRPSSPPHFGASRRPSTKRIHNTNDPVFSTCEWDSCGQKVENTSTAIISHLLSLHRIDLKSRNGKMECCWAGCGDLLCITSLAKHITSIHLGLTVVECPHCPDNNLKQFARVDSLKTHIRTRHPDVFYGLSGKKSNK